VNRQSESQAATIGGEVMLGLHDAAPWISSMVFHLGVILLTVFIVWAMPPEDPPDLPPDITARMIAPVSRDSALGTAELPDLLKRTVERKPVTDSADPGVGVETMKPVKDLTNIITSPAGPHRTVCVFPTKHEKQPNWLALPPASAAQAKKIVYVIDASGSLVQDLGFVIAELKRAMMDLNSDQQFTVIFFQRELAIEVLPHGWKRASDENKRRVADWVTLDQGNIVPGGSSNPMAALRLAMRYKPDAMVLLSDNITGSGRYEIDRRDLLEQLDQLNPERKTRIHTIQFLYPDPLDTLGQIASEHGGTARFVGEGQLLGR
jgi:uncharacterized membrane protein YtjA (UPF0391 family)